MSRSVRSLGAAILALAVAVTAPSCSNDGDPADRLAEASPTSGPAGRPAATTTTEAATTTTAPDGAGIDGPVALGPDGAPSADPADLQEVEGCAGLSDTDVAELGGDDLRVVAIYDTSPALLGPAEGGNGCWFELSRAIDGTDRSADLLTLVHHDGRDYFDAATGSGELGQPINGLGDAAVVLSAGDRSTVITRRGSLVVEAEVSDTSVLDDDLLIAVVGLALERA